MSNFLEKTSKVLVYICGTLLFGSVFIISLEVFLRKFFLVSLGGVDEISSYILGICISWSLAYVLYEKMHIRIDVLYDKFSNKIKALLDILSMAFTLVFVGFLSYYATLVLTTSLDKNSVANTPLGTPLWIPQSLWILGLWFFTLVVTVLLIKGVYAFVKGQKDDALSVKSKH